MRTTPEYDNTVGGPSELFGRLCVGSELLKRVEFGDMALVVEGGAGAYVPVIRAMGVGRVAILDTDKDSMLRAVDRGIIRPDDAYFGTVESYLGEYGRGTVDSAFAFNIDNNFARSRKAVEALGQLVRPSGLVVVSAMNGVTMADFASTALFYGELIYFGDAPNLTRPDDHTGPNAYIQFWQRLSGEE
jgi:hypothetical protein